MLIDLGRNDVGRISKTGEVKVTDKMVIEKYSHVMHIVSNVEGRLKDGITNMNILAATFPAGTLSGAPKIRAMEIIEEVEPSKRGIYGGSRRRMGLQQRHGFGNRHPHRRSKKQHAIRPKRRGRGCRLRSGLRMAGNTKQSPSRYTRSADGAGRVG